MTLDFSTEAWRKNLPTVGPHQATISDINFIPKDDITWMVITWTLASGAAVEELLGVDAPPDSPMLAKTANGKRRLNGLSEMHKIKPSFKGYDDIAAAFIGTTALVVIGHKPNGAMDEPVIRGVSVLEKKK
jgi:hypothetical protein